MNERSTNEGSRFRQLVQKAMDQKMEIANMKTCTILNKAKIEQQSIKIMELNKKVHTLEAKIITLRQQKRKYVQLNMALVNDKNETTEEIKRLKGEISRLKKTIDKLVMDFIVKPEITETLAAPQENEYKKNYNLIF
jgi:outer membrane murein-binding lipoprotein Lpp